MSFLEKRMKQLNIRPLGMKLKAGELLPKTQSERFVFGPEYLDCLVDKWTRGMMMGIIAGSGVGKCLGKDTPVMMYDGSIKKVQDIKVGEQIMGPDYKPRNVLSTCSGREKLYKVKQEVGDDYIVNASHILSFKREVDEEPININVELYLKCLSVDYKEYSCLKGWKSYKNNFNDNLNESFLYEILVEELDEGEYFGFQIDGDRLFLLGDCTVTHNTEIVLDIFEKILLNNLDKPNQVCVFVSLEMSEVRVAKRWIAKVGIDNPISDRFYVIDNFDADGKALGMDLHQIRERLNLIKEGLDVEILCFAVDHLHQVKLTEDISNVNDLCLDFQGLCVEMDSFGIILSQTTKTGGKGDIPLDMTASYGGSGLQWACDFILTLHRPLMRVQAQTSLNVLSWQYAKIREPHPDDPVKPAHNQTLVYDLRSRSLRNMTKVEKNEFWIMFQEVIRIRREEQDNGNIVYHLGEGEAVDTAVLGDGGL